MTARLFTSNAGEDNTDVVYVTYPHWIDVHRQSEHAALLDNFHAPNRNPCVTRI